MNFVPVTEPAARDVIVPDFHDQPGREGVHSADRSVLQQLGPPGALPVKAGRLLQRFELREHSLRTVRSKLEQKPT